MMAVAIQKAKAAIAARPLVRSASGCDQGKGRAESANKKIA